MTDAVIEGIVIGAAGGSIAGVTVWVEQYVREKTVDCIHKRRVYKWLAKNTDKESIQYRTTRAIASWNNLTEERVRYICSIHSKIYLSTGPRDDLWSPYQLGNREN